MKVSDVYERLMHIRAATGDCEAAHAMEDELWRDVLRAIARGATNAKALASVALETESVEFTRWYA